MIKILSNIVEIAARMLLNFNFSFRNNIMGLFISEITPAIEIYNNNDLIK